MFQFLKCTLDFRREARESSNLGFRYRDMQFDVVESKFNLPYMKRCIKYKPAKIYVCGSP